VDRCDIYWFRSPRTVHSVVFSIVLVGALVPNPAAVTTYDDYIPVGERFLPIHIKVRKRALVSLLGCVLTDQELHLIPLTSDFSRLEHVDTPILTKLPNRSLFTRCSVFTSIIGSNSYARLLHFLNV
jgi:hypothetical protein